MSGFMSAFTFSLAFGACLVYIMVWEDSHVINLTVSWCGSEHFTCVV
jgi:hypothetical protein